MLGKASSQSIRDRGAQTASHAAAAAAVAHCPLSLCGCRADPRLAHLHSELHGSARLVELQCRGRQRHDHQRLRVAVAQRVSQQMGEHSVAVGDMGLLKFE